MNSCTPLLGGAGGRDLVPVAKEAPVTCRWCGAEIWLHPLYGWLHRGGALFLCQDLPEGAPPLCVAEPGG